MKSGRDEAARGSIPGSSPRPVREHRKPQPTTCYTVVCVKTAVEISEESRKEGDRHEEFSSSRLPVLAIGSDPTAGDQQVDMGVIAQLAVPGVEHGQHAGQCPEVPFLGTEVLDRRNRDLHQQTVEQLLVATEHRAQL